MQKKLLTISLLVSGRKDTTEKCLDSLKELRAQIDSELILVDTGCDEETKDLLSRYTDQIIEFSWCGDFAKARNAGLEKANGEWFLFLDDDEWFEDVSPIIAFFQSDELQNYDQAVYKARNYSDMQGKNYSEEWVSRIIRLEPDTHFTGKVHEYLTPARGRCKELDAFVHHYGYAFSNEADREAHFMRNEPLLLDMIKQEPGNMHWRVQLVQEYANVKKYDMLRDAGRSTLDFIKNENQSYINQCRGTFYHAVVLGYFLEKRYEDALKCIGQYLTDDRNHIRCNCGLHGYAAECAIKLKDYVAAEKHAADYMKLYGRIQQEPIEDEQERIITDSIVFVKDMLSKQLYDKNRLYWAVSCVHQKKQDKIDDIRKNELKEYVYQMLDLNADFLRLPDMIWEIGQVVDLEAMLLNLDLAHWKAAVSVLTSATTLVEMEKTKHNLESIQTKQHLVFDYFNMYYAKMIVLLSDETETYVSMRKKFNEFADLTLQFYRQVYRDIAFECEMEMLPEHCRAAVWIERMLECGEKNWEEMIRCLREGVKVYPELGENIKKFAAMVGEEQKKEEEQAKEASDQLKAMAEQIKPKVMLMLNNGMAAEAWQVVLQLQQMLPDDAEIKQLEVLVKSKLM